VGQQKGRNGRMQALWAKRKEREAMAKKEEFEKCGVSTPDSITLANLYAFNY
jgi:hypothetical protein